MALNDVQNIKLGACNVTYGGETVGLTKGGVEVDASTSTKTVTVDQFGETIVDEYISGRTVTVKVPLAESDLANLASIVPGATLITDGVDATKKKLEVPTGIGMSLRDNAKELICHPVALDVADKSEDFVVPIAAAKGDLSFAYKYDEERVYVMEFTGYPGHRNRLALSVRRQNRRRLTSINDDRG